jgi:hypothetical protein
VSRRRPRTYVPRSRRVTIRPLPKLEWKTLEEALEEAKTSGKPVLVLFATRRFKGPATLNTRAIRAALKKSGSIPARMLPPRRPRFASGVTHEEYKLATEAYWKLQKQYAATAKKYGAIINPTMLGLAPDGEIISRAYRPTGAQVVSSLKRLPALLKAWKKKKACPPKDQQDGKKEPKDKGRDKPPAPKQAKELETRLGRLVLGSLDLHASVRVIRDAHPARFERFVGILDAVKVEVDWKPAGKAGSKPKVKLTGALKGTLPRKKMNIRRDVAYEITGWKVMKVAADGKRATVSVTIKLGDYPLSGKMTIGAATLSFDVWPKEK